MTSPVMVPAGPLQPVPRPRSTPLDQAILYGSFALLLLCPLLFGAVEPWSTFVLQAGAAVLFLLWSYRQVSSGRLRMTPNALFLPMALFLFLSLTQWTFGLTAYRQETLSQFLLYAAYGCLCFLVAQTFRENAQARRLGAAFLLYGGAVAAFAIVQGLAPNGRIYWLRLPQQGGWIYGPYVNHNHYAGLMEMLLPVPLLCAFSRFAERRLRIVALVFAALMASSVFLSGSRGGMLAVAVEVSVFAMAVLKRGRRNSRALALGLFLVLVVGLLAWIGGGEVARRMASIQAETHAELSGGTRWQIDRDGLRMFAGKPVTGWGLGTFPDAYPRFRSFFTNSFVNEAHNDYLQFLVETGVVGAALGIWFLVALFRRAAPKLGNWSSDWNGATTLAALLGVLGILVHSFVDFNLQIPANAALFYTLCTIAAMDPRFAPSRRARVSAAPAESA